MAGMFQGYQNPADAAAEADIAQRLQQAALLRQRATAMPGEVGGVSVTPNAIGLGARALSAILGKRQQDQALQDVQKHGEQRYNRLLPVMQKMQQARSSEELRQAAAAALQAGDMETYKSAMTAAGQMHQQEQTTLQHHLSQARANAADERRMAQDRAQFEQQMEAQAARDKQILEMQRIRTQASLDRVAQGQGDPADIRSATQYMQRVNAERQAAGQPPLTFEQAYGTTVRAPTIRETGAGFVTPTPEGALRTMGDENGGTPLPRNADPNLAFNMKGAEGAGQIAADQNAGRVPPQLPAGAIPAPGGQMPQPPAPGMPAQPAPPVAPAAQAAPPQGLGYKKSQELGMKLAQGQPKAAAALATFSDKVAQVKAAIKRAKAKTTGWSAGYGSLLSGLPQSDARALAAELAEIKANIGFNELSEMRQNSPTGGALGQVAVQELEYLQASLGALDPRLDPPDLQAKLEQVSQLLDQSQKRLKGAFEQTYGGMGQPGMPPAAAPNSDDDLINKYLQQ